MGNVSELLTSNIPFSNTMFDDKECAQPKDRAFMG
jgi:hypothetical protein